MIDLNYKPKKTEKVEKDPPMIVMILVLAPFAWGLWYMIMQGLINGR